MNPTMETRPKIIIENLSFYYGKRLVLKDISTQILEHNATAIVGPSGQGKSTLLMTMNRLWENLPDGHMAGTVKIRFKDDFDDIYSKAVPPHQLRRKVGMVFQTPNPLPMSIFKNIAFPLKLAGETASDRMANLTEKALKQVFLWEEVKDRLKEDATTLSGGQQQRLCIARALVLKPQILLLDEPTSSLDARSAQVIEELILSLKQVCTIVMVSHYMDQVRRIADTIMEIEGGMLIRRL